MAWNKTTLKDLLPPPVKVSHGEYSMILSAEDEEAKATPTLLQLSLKAIGKAEKTDLTFLKERISSSPFYPEIWPGEHYKLLAGFMQALKPKVTIEIGTATGLSALSMVPFLPKNGKLVTFDIFPWNEHPQTVLKEADFEEGPFSQIVGDLGNYDFFQKNKSLLESAELIFIDAKHDGHLEKRLVEFLSWLNFKKPPFLLFDDIRVWSMLKFWREISYPKLDLTSFGHWSGTGIVHLISEI